MDIFPCIATALLRLDCLQSIATWFGRFLGTDKAALYRTRAIGARICVEDDLLDDSVSGFPLVAGSRKP